MNITERLKLELLIRQQIEQHGDDFYAELARILSKIQLEQIDDRGRPALAVRRA